MKILFLYLQFLICFSNLLDQVRIEVVDKALIELPKRESIDILKMALEMSSAQDQNSMTDAESAYFAYKWIGQNIDYDIDNYYSLDYVDVDQKEYFKMVKQYVQVILVK